MITRRFFCTGLIAAPAIVRVSSLMTLSGYTLKDVQTLEQHNLTLSWMEQVGPGRWRMNGQRFSAAQSPPVVEINPSHDALQVAGATIDGPPSAIYGAGPIPYTHTWRLGPPVIRPTWLPPRSEIVIELDKAEEQELLARNSDTV